MPPANGKEEARVHWRTISHGGTMKGKMGEWEPTGKEYHTQGAFRIDFKEGKIRSILSYWDTATMLRQLGLIPRPD